MSNGITLCIRKRPCRNSRDSISVVNNNTIDVVENTQDVYSKQKLKVHSFKFNNVFSETSTNRNLYDKLLANSVVNLFANQSTIIYTYGYTGSGKTFTIFGEKKVSGLLLLAANDIFRLKKQNNVLISAYEIYNNNAYDLMKNDKKSLPVREDAGKNINVVGLVQLPINDFEEFYKCITVIKSNRRLGVSSQNGKSSRSHSVISLEIAGLGKIIFIDLAGSEKASKNICANKKAYTENSEINKSILALKECVRAVKNNDSHIPFRSSKLTTIIRDAFTERYNTIIIGTVSPEVVNVNETLNTLTYVSDMKVIKQSEVINYPKIIDPAAANARPKQKQPIVMAANAYLKQPVPIVERLCEKKQVEIKVSLPKNNIVGEIRGIPPTFRDNPFPEEEGKNKVLLPAIGFDNKTIFKEFDRYLKVMSKLTDQEMHIARVIREKPEEFTGVAMIKKTLNDKLHNIEVFYDKVDNKISLS